MNSVTKARYWNLAIKQRFTARMKKRTISIVLTYIINNLFNENVHSPVAVVLQLFT